MKQKTKKIIYRIIKIVWFAIGGFILAWTIFWFIQMNKIKTLGVIAIGAIFAYGLLFLIIYIIITLLFLALKFIIKKLKKRK